ncbi:PilN domain-containing protein (plasmid) [Skermanella mucosa]|uniref:PilN domain-containing protein n=1 Tax=Skermanella mucosa TaxID=1789672 RepID=UPI001E395BEF|nr:PilN domain-containing protein [Skermanella mucosa]UEM24401.1 PilN domain-containing protein [Skermanella mucosa]
MGPWNGRIGSGIWNFLRWWGGELTALVPRRLSRALSRRSRCFEVVVEPECLRVFAHRAGRRRFLGSVDRPRPVPGARIDHGPISVSEQIRDLVRNRSGSRCETALIVPAGTALRRTVTLPAAAAENLREVLSFEMDRLTPFRAEDVYNDYRIVSGRRAGGVTTGRQLLVDLVVVCRSDVDWALDLIRSAGLKPEWLEVAGWGGEAYTDLLPRTGGEANRRRYRMAAVLAGIALALVAARTSLPLYQQERHLAELDAAVTSARVRALEADRLRADLDAAIHKERYLADLKRRSPASIDILSEVTRLLPDDTWLASLNMRAGSLSLSGFSAKASALIALLEESALLEDVQFRSQVSFERTGGVRGAWQDADGEVPDGRAASVERFSISARLSAIGESLSEPTREN